MATAAREVGRRLMPCSAHSLEPVAFGASLFKALILQAQHNLSDARMEFMIRDRLSWMRFLGFDLGGPTPDENTIRHFRNRLTESGTLKRVMKAFDWQLKKKGYIPMSGRIVDASLVPAPKQRNTDGERDAIKAGKSAREIWPDEPNRAAQKDTSARWTLKVGGKVRYRPDGAPLPQIATPVFGYKSHICIDRRYGFIRESAVTSASAADGRMLRHLVTTENTSSEVWADSAYRSQTNEKWLAGKMLTSRIHRRKPKGRPMPQTTARANAKKSAIRARVEHVFAHQKTRFGLFIRTIGIARAEAKLTLANLAYNFDRLVFHERRAAMG
jgi:transposase, IS5 family